MKEKNKISIGNYFKVFAVSLVVIFVSFLLRSWYINDRNYELNIPVITKTLLSEINTEEVYNYVHENEDTILYLGVANDINCRNFEKEFNKVIKERYLEDTITYLNLTKEVNRSKFIDDFNNFYNINLSGYPSIVIFKDGEVKATLDIESDFDINKVILFLDENSVVSNSL